MADGALEATRSRGQAWLVSQVKAALQARALTLPDAARQIGVGAATLRKHLDGEHVRSDSALKYQDWLDGRSKGSRSVFLDARDAVHLDRRSGKVAITLPPPPAKPRIVVDIFSGCGGLSLGFDLLDGAHFRTGLAIDLEEAPITVLNANDPAGRGVGRRADLTEFLNETEFLAFYLESASSVHRDPALTKALAELQDGALPAFKATMAAVDARFIKRLTQVRCSSTWASALQALDREALGQTSVAAFHQTLRLPRTGAGAPRLPNLLWTNAKPSRAVPAAPGADSLDRARSRWIWEIGQLTSKREATGRGQLNASARRISAFLDLATSETFEPVREAWIEWSASRLELRDLLFSDQAFAVAMRALYERSHPVSVLVGGPPCQGFSRIGRGKLRSLRDARVQVHGSTSAGDVRNLLFLQYVMILGALRPTVFLFENVQHFESTVHAEDGDFQATEVLEEAIASMSDGEARYGVTSRVLNAARHGVPQNRLRYFMCGVDSAVVGEDKARRLAEHCLSPPEEPEIPLSAALEGLGEPALVRGEGSSRAAMRTLVPLARRRPGRGQEGFESWVRQPRPGRIGSPSQTDAHAGRAAREDDARFFALLGPGRRWMDYRSDDSKTLRQLQTVFEALGVAPDNVLASLFGAGLSGAEVEPKRREELRELSAKLDGSLALRLLLEQIEGALGYPHHLIREVYLSKRDGAHGDWLHRMDPDRPSKTMVSHMSKDTYAFVHPRAPRTISVREAARIQSFPDWYSFGEAALTDAFRMIGNAVPPRLSHAIAAGVAYAASQADAREELTGAALMNSSAG
jgi:site-specific DNA-cytosine methylase